MSEEALEQLSDVASDAHARIQDAYQHINPVVEVRRGMRDAGIPADVMTVDCLRTRRRILLVLHDDEPGTVLYEFAGLDEDVGDALQRIDLADFSVDTLFEWMRDFFWGPEARGGDAG